MSQQVTSGSVEQYRVPLEIGAAITNPVAYAGDRPIEKRFQWLRANNPVGWVEVPGYDSFWVVTKHADIQRIGRNNDLFHSGDRSILLMDSASVRRTVELSGSQKLMSNILFMDNPDHHLFRQITSTWFLPHQVAKRTDAIRRIARATVERMLAAGPECEFVTDVAVHYPLQVILEILGAPQKDAPLILRLTQELMGLEDPDKGRGDSETYSDRFINVLRYFRAYLQEIMVARRGTPTDDVASVIANGTVNGEMIAESDVLDYYIALATAGHDTTASSTAGAIWGLAENPAEFAKVKQDRTLIPSLVEEAIRWTTPVAHFMRSATADNELHSRQIKKGDWLMLSYLSGNRDEDVFPDAGFRVDRNPNRHISFGYGVHMCLGMHLAKLEMRILFEELLEHIDSVELTGAPKRTESTGLGGPKRLPVRFTAH